MASLRQIRRRIRTIQSTKQIMRAMQLVSASKFQRAQGRLLQGRQMLEFLDGLLQRILATGLKPEHPLSVRRDAAPSALVLVTSDTGLAGSYNNGLIQLAEAELRKDTARRVHVSFIGKRGHRYFTKRGAIARDAHLDLAGRPDLVKIDAIGKALMDRFLAGEIGSVQLLYAKCISPTVSTPTLKTWLPIQLAPAPQAPLTTAAAKPAKGRYVRVPVDYLFEPSPRQVFEDLLPRWTIATFRLALLEAFTAEHGARMIAMKNATDNAQELVEALTRQRNSIRQASITKELSEIVGTAEALK